MIWTVVRGFMKILGNMQKTVSTVKDVLCNKCGKSCEGFEYVELSTSWGYFSNKDLEHHESHICEKCYDDFVKTFTIPVDKTEYKA